MTWSHSLSSASTRLSWSHPQLYATQESSCGECLHAGLLRPVASTVWCVVLRAVPSENLSANYCLRTGEVAHFMASSPFHKLFGVCLHLAHLPFSSSSLQDDSVQGYKSIKELEQHWMASALYVHALKRRGCFTCGCSWVSKKIMFC